MNTCHRYIGALVPTPLAAASKALQWALKLESSQTSPVDSDHDGGSSNAGAAQVQSNAPSASDSRKLSAITGSDPSDSRKLSAITGSDPSVPGQWPVKVKNGTSGASAHDNDDDDGDRREPPDLVLFNICAWAGGSKERSKAGLEKLLR